MGDLIVEGLLGSAVHQKVLIRNKAIPTTMDRAMNRHEAITRQSSTILMASRMGGMCDKGNVLDKTNLMGRRWRP